MTEISRLQDYLRQSAGRRYDVQSIPPFTLFFHPANDLTYFNYAIPDSPVMREIALADPLARLIDAFRVRERVPRFEYLREYAPGLQSPLAAVGFVEDARQPFMVCTPAGACPVPTILGLTIETFDRRATLPQARAFWSTQRSGFDPGAAVAITDEDATRLLGEIEDEVLLLATLGGEPVGAGMLMSAIDGIVELAGLATLRPYRRRGIATALTAHALRLAFARGAEAVCLTAEDEKAGRVYARAGFITVATACSWSVPG